MYGFFEKHGKKFLATAAVLLIVVMLLPPTAGNYGGGGSSRLGKIDGKALDAAEIDGTIRSLETLDNIFVRTQAGDAPLLGALFGQEAYSNFRQDPRLFHLLVREAETNGVVASESDVGDVLRNEGTRIRLPQGDTRDFATIEQSNAAMARSIEDAVRSALSVFGGEQHAQRSIKVSAPAVRQALARQTQEIRIRVLPFDAAALQGGIGVPTNAQLTEQFNAFAAVKAGSTDEKTNAFGFGYRVPDRVKIDYVEVPVEEVRRAVEASKSAEEWDEEAQLLYLRDPSRFAAVTTQPATTQSTQPAGPTTRAFAEAKADVLKALRQPLIEQRRRAVVNRVQQQLAGHYAMASENGATTQQVEAATPAYGVPYASFQYLEKVRDDVQRQFNVGVRVTREGEWLSESQLATHPVLGNVKTEPAGNDRPRSAGEYVFGSLRPFHAGDAMTASGLIGLYEPSKPLTSDATSVIVRATAAEASHPAASLADVRADVERDVRRKLAFEKATAEAEAAMKAGALAGPGLETSGWFKTSDFMLPGIDKSAAADSYLLIGPSFKLLKGLKSPGDLPVRKVVPLHAVNRVCVVELFDLRSTVTADEMELFRQAAAMQLQQTEVRLVGLQQSWFDRDSVFRRMKFEPAEGPGDNQPAPAAPRPRNPLMP